MAIPHEYAYTAALVDSDTTYRMRLKQATTSVPRFKNCQQFSNLNELKSKLNSTEPFDLIFLSKRFGDAAISSFVKDARDKKATMDAAFILVLEGKDDSQSQFGEYMLLGINGFLVEPYSVDKLVETTLIAAKVKKDRSLGRRKLAFQMLLKDLEQTVDILSISTSGTSLRTKIEKRIESLHGTIADLDQESVNIFVETLVDHFAEISSPAESLDVPSYAGASSRVKKILERKLLEKLEKMEKSV